MMDAAAVKSMVLAAGATAVGIAEAVRLPDGDIAAYRDWLADGCAAGMDYLSNHEQLRADPRMLLPGARSVIVAAFAYDTATPMPTPGGLRWARYALGDDYHDVLRCCLTPVAEAITAATGAECRICVDTAPLRERLWAVRAGVGFIGQNCQFFVPGLGSGFFLAEIITTLSLEADSPCTDTCLQCGACRKACPGGALSLGQDGRARLDARRCLSYLTIENRDLAPVGNGSRIYGCDVCQDVCPLNRRAAITAPLPEFHPRPGILALTRADILGMTQEQFSALFRRSAIKRAKLAGLRRNASDSA